MILKQYKNSYRYNSDTIFLYNFIARHEPKGLILDVGSGCGILGLLIKRDFPDIELCQVEIQERFAKLSVENAKINNLESKVINGDFLITLLKTDLILLSQIRLFTTEAHLRAKTDLCL